MNFQFNKFEIFKSVYNETKEEDDEEKEISIWETFVE